MEAINTPKEPELAEFPELLANLFHPFRYKVLFGGRGGSKSHSIAKALLTIGSSRPLRVLCARELQKSIKDSVHRLLADQIALLDLESFYEVTQASIRGRNGTEFFFEGLRHNAHNIKSYEGIDVCWVEEAHLVSKSSWDLLIPTIRKDGSEIWISFNPELEEDETYQRFVVRQPTNSFVQKVNWRDNPWFPDVLRQEMADLKARDPVSWKNIWEGYCRQAVDGAIFEDEMTAVHEEGRIMRVPYDRTKPVNTFWDLGYGDQTAIWFVQKVGLEYHIIDYYQNARKLLPHYIETLQNRKYIYGTHYLPHDGRSNQLVGHSVEDTLQNLGWSVEVVPRVAQKIDSLNAARTAFPSCVFDKDKCADGLQALRRYRYKLDSDTGIVSKLPLHDDNSNGADAFQTFATAPNIWWETTVGDSVEYVSDYDPFSEARM